MSQTDRNRRYSQRQIHRAAALQSGSTWLDVLAATVSADGTELVVITLDGARYAGKITLDSPAPGKPSKKVYAPKSWDPKIWNDNVARIRETGMAKKDVLKNITEISKKKSDPGAELKIRHLRAVLDAMPDTPDWYAELPLADENDSQVAPEA